MLIGHICNHIHSISRALQYWHTLKSDNDAIKSSNSFVADDANGAPDCCVWIICRSTFAKNWRNLSVKIDETLNYSTQPTLRARSIDGSKAFGFRFPNGNCDMFTTSRSLNTWRGSSKRYKEMFSMQEPIVKQLNHLRTHWEQRKLVQYCVHYSIHPINYRPMAVWLNR